MKLAPPKIEAQRGRICVLAMFKLEWTHAEISGNAARREKIGGREISCARKATGAGKEESFPEKEKRPGAILAGK